MIAILGGSFDPVHIGHLRVAIEVRDRLQPEQVRLIPCGQPPHRSNFFATADQRLQMLECAVSREQGLSVDDRELRLSRISYTVSTLSDLRRELGDDPIGLIVGADAFQQLNTWFEWTCLFELAHIIVVHRPGYTLTDNPEVTGYTSQRKVESLHQLKRQSSGLVLFLEIPALDVSSTRVRQMVLKGRSIRYLVPDLVYDWIQEHQIYQFSE